MSTFDLFIIFGPLCAGAIMLAVAFEVARITKFDR
jgi:hypothetical protein